MHALQADLVLHRNEMAKFFSFGIFIPFIMRPVKSGHAAANSDQRLCRRYRWTAGFDRRTSQALLHVSLNRRRFKDKDMQQFKVLQRPLRV
jgi:hypothetical protein